VTNLPSSGSWGQKVFQALALLLLVALGARVAADVLAPLVPVLVVLVLLSTVIWFVFRRRP
jgi:FtsH-binding integral membrane protein